MAVFQDKHESCHFRRLNSFKNLGMRSMAFPRTNLNPQKSAIS